MLEMKPKLSRFWKELLETTLAFLAIGISIADMLSMLDRMPWAKERVPAITLLLLSGLVVYEVLSRGHELEVMRGSMVQALKHFEKILGFSRDFGVINITTRGDPAQLKGFSRLLEEAKSDLFIVGVTLKDTTSQRREGATLVNKAQAGCSLRFLMLNPKYWRNYDPVLDPVASVPSPRTEEKQESRPGNLRADFKQGISNLCQLAELINTENAFMEVRFYDQAPTLSLTAVNGKGGKMRVEFSPYNCPGLEYFRPMLDLQPAGDRSFHSEFYSRYEKLWQHSTVFLAVHGKEKHIYWEALSDDTKRELGV